LHGGLEATAHAVTDSLGAPPAIRDLVAKAYAGRYAARIAQDSRLYPGVVPAVRSLREARVGIGVCTNKAAAQAERLLQALGILDLVDVLVGADTTPHRKPHPLPLLHAIDRLGASVEGTVLVGDSIVDARCAGAAGVPFVHFRGGYGGEDVARADAFARFDAFEHDLITVNPAPPA
jgi:phosphoglycolate phosphatase